MDKHVPSRTVKNRREVPWLNREIKRKISKRRRLYKRAKSTLKMTGEHIERAKG